MIIDKYDMTIYPRKLWVATGWGKETPRRFTYDDGETELEDVGENYGAATYGVCERKDGCYGVLIVFKNTPSYENGSEVIEDVSHESVHAAGRTFKELGVRADYDNDEPMAYLVGWVAKCCWFTLSKEIYKDKVNEQK